MFEWLSPELDLDQDENALSPDHLLTGGILFLFGGSVLTYQGMTSDISGVGTFGPMSMAIGTVMYARGLAFKVVDKVTN